jgi:uncharacterized protein
VDITPLIPAGRQIIESYGDGRFRVSGTLFEQSILVFPDRTLPWAPVAASEITQESLDEIARAGTAGTVDVLLIGCGARMAMMPAELRRALRAAGIVIEPMDTGAACRTYNVLMSEGRLVAAALIAVG